MTQLLAPGVPDATPGPTAQARGASRRPIGLWALGLLIIVVLGYLVLSPLLYLVWRGLTTGKGFGLGNIAAAYNVPGTSEMLLNSFLFAGGSALVSTVTGTALAFFCVRSNAPLKPLLYAASIVPLIVPGILYTISWVYLIGGNVGVIKKLFGVVGLGFIVPDAFSLPGMILIDGLHLSPLVFLLMFAAFKSTDPSLEESAMMSGASVPQTVRRVTLPLVRPALLGAVLIMVVRGLESFETPAVLGMPSGTWVFTSRIYDALHTYPIKYDQASIYSVSLLLITVAGLLLVQYLNRRSERFQTVTGKGFRPRPMDLGAWRWPVSIGFVVYFLIAVVAPLLILLWMSLLPYYQTPGITPLKTITLSNYAELFQTRGVV